MLNNFYNNVKRYKRSLGYDQKWNWDKHALFFMKDCKNILDVGCGVGRFIGHDSKRIIGIDQSKESLQECLKKKYRVVEGQVTCLPFLDNSFEAVHCCHVIEHLLPKSAHKLLVEMNRVLCVNGILCLRTPLMHSDFYGDFTHIKPYPPKAILHYLNNQQTKQTTLTSINNNFNLIKIKYRYPRLFVRLSWPLSIPFIILALLGVKNYLQPTGYILVMKKNEN